MVLGHGILIADGKYTFHVQGSQVLNLVQREILSAAAGVGTGGDGGLI